MPDSVEEYLITPHPGFEMQRRGIDEALLAQVLANPEQRDSVRPGRDVVQSRISVGERTYLIRIIVDVDRSPAEVVTAYRTSKLFKYWRPES